MLRKLGLLLVLAALLIALLPATNAQSGDATVIPQMLNVRAVPNGAAIGEYPMGTVLDLEGREDDPGNGGVWVLGAPVSGGTRGWVNSDYLQFTGVNLYDLPSIPSNPVDGAPAAPQAQEQPAQETAPAADGTLTGSVRSTANVRSGPGTNYSRVATLNPGTAITLTGRDSTGNWVTGNLGGTQGWIYISLIRVNGNVASLPVVQPPAQEQAAPAAGNPAPVASGGGFGGFGYGAHVYNFDRVDRMHYAGMTWAKVQVRFSPGDHPDAGIINAAHANGIKILLGVVGHPNDVLGGEAYFNTYASYVAELARMGADAIEIWNEPNLDKEWANGTISGASYTRLLALSYNAIKSANPNTMVISGALAPTGFFGGCQAAGCDDAPYLAAMKAAGAASYMDCLGIHYNEGIISPRSQSGDPRGGHYTHYFYGMVNTYYNMMGKPLCFTELGYVTGEGYGAMPPAFAWGDANTLAEQAQWVADSVALSRGDRRIRMVIIWNLNFPPQPGSADPTGAYALIRPDGSCPACDRLAGR